jgi:hypothetical protein
MPTVRSCLSGLLLSAAAAAPCAAQLSPAPMGLDPIIPTKIKDPNPSQIPKVLDLKSLPLLEDLQYDTAKHKARESTRFMLVFWTYDHPGTNNWSLVRCQSNISLRAWIKWHAVAIWMPTLPPEISHEACSLLLQQKQTTPAVLIMRNGAIERIVGTERQEPMGLEVKHCPPCSATAIDCEPDHRLVPHPVAVMYHSDFAMDRVAARDPVWVDRHNLANPPPQPPPEPEPANMMRDELAPVIYDPRPEEHIGALDRLDEARRLMKSGDLYQATGVYTWLWERAAAMDPAFRPAKLSALAQDMSTLVGKRAGAGERFQKIREDRNERLPWADYGQMHEWFVLSGVTRNSADSLEYLDYYINDTDEGTMLPPTDSMAFKLLSRREDFVRAWERPKDVVARVKAIADRLDPRFPAHVQEKERNEYKEFAKQYLLDEGCRLYVACLMKGDDVTAQQVAEIILKARNDAAARLSLITTALSADPQQSRLIHTTWLDEAESASGVRRPDLRNRLTFGVREPAEKK